MLLYRGSVDGWKPKDFHKRCDNKGPTLTIIKTKGGTICGGFTMQNWESSDGFK